MAVSIVSSQTISGDTFYRNKPFDISFSIVNPPVADTSISFLNSTYRVLPYTSGSNFRGTSGIPDLGSIGTLSVDVVTRGAKTVQTLTSATTYGMCFETSTGFVYAVLPFDHMIVAVDSNGTQTRFAGTGFPGYDNGPRLSASFTTPRCITTDGSGTLYVGDDYTIRKIDSAGTVTLLAGSGSSGFQDGTGAAATFGRIASISIHPTTGVLYVVDQDNHAIRTVTSSGVVTTYAGDGTFGLGTGRVQGISPYGVYNGDLYKTGDGVIWSANGTTVGNTHVLAYSNSLYVAAGESSGGNTIYTSPDTVTWTGRGNTVSSNIKTVTYGNGVWVSGGLGVTNTGAYSTNNGVSWTGLGTTPFGASGPNRIVYANGVWLAALNGSASLTYSKTGSNWTSLGSSIISAPAYDVLNADGRWYAVGYNPNSFAYTTDVSGTWTSVTTTGIDRYTAIEYHDGMYLRGGMTTLGATVVERSSDGINWTTITNSILDGLSGAPLWIRWSDAIQSWFIHGTAYDAVSLDTVNWTYVGNQQQYIMETNISTRYKQFSFPTQACFDSNALFYIADSGNQRVALISNDTVTTYIGTTDAGNTSGPRTSVFISHPSGIAIDRDGLMYISSDTFHDIRQLIGCNVSTYAGSYGVSGYQDGKPSTSLFSQPYTLATGNGTVYVADVDNARIRSIVPVPDTRPGALKPAGYTIIATSNYPITVNSRMDVCWTSIGGTIQLYKYESFSNTVSAKSATPDDTMTYSTTSTELLGYMAGTGTSTASFRAANGATTTYPYALTLWVRANSNGAVVDDVSTSVLIGPARLVYSPCNATIALYRNEPVSPVSFSILCNAASTVYSSTTLPTGLSFTRTASNTFALTGTPTVQTFTSNYSILGQDTSGRIYTTQVSIGVNPERLVIDISGSTSFSSIQSNVAIPQMTMTSRMPPYTGFRALTYTWSPPLPAGLQFSRKDGTAVLGSSETISSTTDASFALTLKGTITDAQLRTFAFANTRTYTTSVTATRSTGGTALSPSVPTTLTFTFAPTIFFTSNVPSLYVNLPVSNWSYTAKTYFADASITNISLTSGFLPDGMDGVFVSNAQRYEISGTPLYASSYSFTLLATNGVTSVALPVSVATSNDSVSITTTADSCFNFIQYRPLSNAKSGYYPAQIRYTATARSGCNVVITGSNLPTGVTLTSDTSGVYDLSGVPLSAAGASTAVLTGTVAASGGTGTTSFAYSVSAEVFTFDTCTFAFAQNVPVTPVQTTATTFSEQPILRYSSPNLPAALTITNTGLVTGTPEGSAGGSFDVTAFTAYSSGSAPYSYTMTPDKVLLVPSTYSLTTAPGCNVSIPITGYSLSARTVSNYSFQDPFAYGLGVNSTSGLVSGTLASSLPNSTSFTVVGSAGLVDGSLQGTVTTNNLTVNRAQMIHLPTTADLTIYSTDDNGATWSNVYAQSNAVASTVGLNGSNVFLVPTSTGYVLRSTTGASYPTAIPLTLSRSPFLSAIVNKPGTATWWMAGTQSNVGLGTRSVYLFTSTDDGLTWDAGTAVTTGGFTDRAGTPTPPTSTNPAYLNGVALAYKDGVLLLGGNQILRSTDEGGTWSTVSSGLVEVADFSVDHETVWIAAGTDTYPSQASTPLLPVTLGTSLRYSTDFGASWSSVTGDFTMAAFQVRYGAGVWLASGFDRDATTATGTVRVSFDGVNWSTVSSVPSYTYTFGSYASLSNPPVGLFPIARDDTEWKVLRAPADGTAGLYTHSDGLPMTSGWTSQTVTSQFSGISSSSRFYSYVAQTIDPGADVTTITFPLPNNGPTFVSPAQSTFVVWQYMPIPTITFSAVGTGPIVYFISSLPVGLTWNSTTESVSGSCMRTGTQTFAVYAKDGLGGITAFQVTLLVEVPRIVKKQSSAGAYTSLVRQYTEVNAAQTARDSRALPDQTTGIGEFASPYPPSVVTPSNCPC